MDRRDFLKRTLATTGGAVALGALDPGRSVASAAVPSTL